MDQLVILTSPRNVMVLDLGEVGGRGAVYKEKPVYTPSATTSTVFGSGYTCPDN